MFERTIDGVPLTFHLAGINNQNFLMRDEQTGTYWQQISGRAVSGPLAGRTLRLIPADELSFALWKTEEPGGTVLQDAPGHARDYAPEDWDAEMARVPVVISFAQAGLKPRDIMLGVEASGEARAFPYERVLKEKVVQDHIGATRLLLVTGPDNRSIRAFNPPANIAPDAQFYRIAGDNATVLDSATGSHWNFQGCAVDGSLKGACMQPVNVIKDYWFDWRNYHPDTTVYGIRQKIR